MNDLLENRLQKRNDHGTPSAETLIRRHTTPDMAASAAYGMGTLRRKRAVGKD